MYRKLVNTMTLIFFSWSHYCRRPVCLIRCIGIFLRFQAHRGPKIIYCIFFTRQLNPAKRNAMVVKNEKRFLKQKRNALKNPGYSRHPVKTQASFKRLLKAV